MGKYVHENKIKMNISVRVAAVLLCLTLFSTYLVAGLFARYATSAQSNGNARVAKFSIAGGGMLSQSIEASLIPGESGTETIEIQNNSEVAVEYTVAVTNETENLPLSFRMEKEGTSSAVAVNGTPFTDQQLPGSHTDRYTLYIDWKAEDNDPARMGMVDRITVTVTAAQID